ncbi:MAG: hypothetical protein JNK45_26830 [Myxococcales bacterium]|nr:hypothetical protein [Myxococcales bacterium]
MHSSDAVTEPSPDGDRVVIYQSGDRDGSTFELSSRARRMLEMRFAGAVHFAPRVFIAHETRADFERLHGSLARQIVMLLTGLTEERLAEVGSVEFRDPVTEKPLR